MSVHILIWVAVAFGAAACWGAVVIVNKRVLHLVNPIPVNLFVSLICLATLLVITLPLTIFHLWSLGFGMTWEAAGYVAASAFVNSLLTLNFYYYALRSGQVGVVVPLTSIDPLFTALFAMALLGAALAGLTIAGLLLAIVGIILIARWTDKSEAEQHPGLIAGQVVAGSQRPTPVVVALSLATAAGWGLSPVLIERALASTGGATTTMVLGGHTLGVILIGALVLWRRRPLFTRSLQPGEMRRVIKLLIVAGILEGVVASFYYLLIQEIGAVLTTLIIATSAVFAIIGGVLFLKERIGPKLALGITVTLAGVFLATLQRAL